MKKNTISKVLLVFVMLALIFSLAACGGNKNNGGSSGGGKKTELTALTTPADVEIKSGVASWGKVTGAGEFEYIAYKEDGTEGTTGTTGTGTTERKYTMKEGEVSFKVRAIPADTSKNKTSEWSKLATVEVTASQQVLKLLDGVSGLIDTFNAVTTTSTLSADLGISGYFNTTNSTNKIKLDAQANAGVRNPEALINFQMNDKNATTETMKDYVSLGYKGGKLYIREPINFINTDETVANAYEIDVTALATCVPVWMGYAMEAIADKDIDFSELQTTVSGVLNGKLSSIINSILKKGLSTDPETGSTTLGLTVDLLGTATEMLDMIGVDKIEAKVDEYIGYANKAFEVMNNMGLISFKELQLNGEKVTFDSIIALFQEPDPAIKDNSVITINFKVNSDKVIEKIDLALNLGAFAIQGVDYTMGLTVDLKKFSLSSTADVNPTGFSAKDLVIDLKGALPQKGLEGNTVVGVVRLSNGLANATNKWADVTATTTGGNKSYAYVNAAGAYADFSGVFKTLGVADTYKAKYSYTYDNLITKLIANVVKPSNAAPKNAAGDEDEDFMALIMSYANGIGAASNKADYISGIIYKEVIARFVDKELVVTGQEGQKELIQYLFDYKLGDTNTSAKDYALFYNNAQTFEALLDNIKACHEQGKPALDAAINTDTKIAGIQLFMDGDNNDLLDYVAKFVVIPSIKDGEPSFAQTDLKAPNDKVALKGWLNWIFPTTNEYRGMVEGILGITLEGIIDGGVYVEAKANTGLNGEVCVAADSTKAKTYVGLGAGIAIKAGSPAVSDITAQVTFNAKNEETQKYYIAEAGKAMLDALRAYTPAE